MTPGASGIRWTALEVVSELVESSSGSVIELRLTHSSRSPILQKAFVVSGQVARAAFPAEFCELGHFLRTTGPPLSLRALKAYVQTFLPVAFILSDRLPLVMQADGDWIRAFGRIAERYGYRCRIIATGLSDHNEVTGGSDDEQILVITCVR